MKDDAQQRMRQADNPARLTLTKGECVKRVVATRPKTMAERKAEQAAKK